MVCFRQLNDWFKLGKESQLLISSSMVLDTVSVPFLEWDTILITANGIACLVLHTSHVYSFNLQTTLGCEY